MVITTDKDKIDVLIYNAGAGGRRCGNGITYIEYGIDIFDDADVWKVVENPDDYSMSVVHVGNHF